MELNNLKELRKTYKITQLETANALNIPLRTYNAYENGEYQPNIETLIKIADYFDVSVDYLIGHRQNNKIDKSGLTETQKNIIDMVSQLNDIQANRVESYTLAKLEEQEDMKEKYDKRILK